MIFIEINHSSDAEDKLRTEPKYKSYQIQNLTFVSLAVHSVCQLWCVVIHRVVPKVIR